MLWFALRPLLRVFISQRRDTGEAFVSDWLVDIFNIPWVGVLIGFLLFLLSIPIGYFFYLKGRSFARLTYSTVDNEVIAPTGGENSKLEVTYNKISVLRVTTTNFAIWNSGTTTIHGDQIVRRDHLRISSADYGKILEADTRDHSRSVIQASVTVHEDRQSAAINFDFLDPGDGFRINIVHSGDLGSLTLMGTVKGLPSGATPSRKPNPLSGMIDKFLTACALITIVQIAFSTASTARASEWPWLYAAGFMLSVGAVVVTAVFGPVWLRKIRFRNVPHALRAVVELEALLPSRRKR